MDTLKVNQLRHLVESEIGQLGSHEFTRRAYWRGVRETLFVVLQLDRTFDRSTVKEIFDKLKQYESTEDLYHVEFAKRSQDDCA